MAVRRRVSISGRVQGVWFRGTCANQADAAGVAGWVRNLPDGRVEAVFEGDEAAVERLVDWCRVGPRFAHVEHVDVVDEPPQGEQTFRVR